MSDRAAYLLVRCAERSEAWREELARPFARAEIARIARRAPSAFAEALAAAYEDPERIRRPRAWLAASVEAIAGGEAG